MHIRVSFAGRNTSQSWLYRPISVFTCFWCVCTGGLIRKSLCFFSSCQSSGIRNTVLGGYICLLFMVVLSCGSFIVVVHVPRKSIERRYQC